MDHAVLLQFIKVKQCFQFALRCLGGFLEYEQQVIKTAEFSIEIAHSVHFSATSPSFFPIC